MDLGHAAPGTREPVFILNFLESKPGSDRHTEPGIRLIANVFQNFIVFFFNNFYKVFNKI